MQTVKQSKNSSFKYKALLDQIEIQSIFAQVENKNACIPRHLKYYYLIATFLRLSAVSFPPLAVSKTFPLQDASPLPFTTRSTCIEN